MPPVWPLVICRRVVGASICIRREFQFIHYSATNGCAFGSLRAFVSDKHFTEVDLVPRVFSLDRAGNDRITDILACSQSLNVQIKKPFLLFAEKACAQDWIRTSTPRGAAT